MLSEKYGNCCGVAIVNCRYSGLTHYWRDAQRNPSPEEYMLDLISQFIDLLGIDGLRTLRAGVVGGDKEHFETLKDILGDAKLPVVGEYCDGWGDSDNLHVEQLKLPVRQWKYAHKELLVIPETQEVLMYAANVGYKKLI